jgi:2-polyprenyl-3-methyl-5-hydroxy-6-metoxy-1,4-benzoquinol methylase
LIKFETREICCICGHNDLIQKVTIKKFPIYMGVTNQNEKLDEYFDQIWAECSKCGCLQLLNLLPLSEIYKSNHHTEVVGQTWKEHHDAFSEFISTGAPKRILEIGAAHGYLATALVTNLPNIQYTIVEPDSNLVDSRILIIKGYIEENFAELKNKDCIVHSHVLEHVYDPVSFINEISRHSDFGTNMYISFPNMHGLIESGGLNSLNFEHTYLLDPSHAELIFKNAGLTIKSKKKYKSHSFFYHLLKESDTLNSPLEYPNISWQSQEFQKMVQSLKEFVASSNKTIQNCNGPVFLFGAHIFSQSLLSFGLTSDKVIGILDNSQGKQNMRLYGTSLPVLNPEVISQAIEPVVVLNASHYQNEIRNQLLILNPNVKIIEKT